MRLNPAPPIGDDEFAAHTAPFAHYPRLAVAVSGGSDSLALLFLLAEWRKQQTHPPALFALTINHHLRAEADEEAYHAARVSRQLGVPHHVLVWHNARAGTGLQARARKARMALLARWCARTRTPALLLAHQLEDQAATFLFRLARGSSPVGLAAMQPVMPAKPPSPTLFRPTLFRPLLSFPRARLQASLAVAGIAWRDDPSNHHPSFARTHLERLLPLLAHQGLSPTSLARAAKGAAELRTSLESLAAKMIIHQGERESVVPIAALLALPPQAAYFVIGRAVAQMGGRDHPPSAKACKRILQNLSRQRACRETLAGCYVQAYGNLLHITPCQPASAAGMEKSTISSHIYQ